MSSLTAGRPDRVQVKTFWSLGSATVPWEMVQALDPSEVDTVKVLLVTPILGPEVEVLIGTVNFATIFVNVGSVIRVRPFGSVTDTTFGVPVCTTNVETKS